MASTEEQRAEAAERRRAAMQERSAHPRLAERAASGGGRGDEVRDRQVAFPAEIRAEVRERDGKDFLVADGYATTWERSYEMWDVFGPYRETVARNAADATIEAKPDVVFLVNHRGLAMARTGGPWNGGNATLELSVDDHGLRSVAWLNPEREDVRALRSAIGDDIVTEMSFAFMIDRGEWSEDFSEFTIQQFDINRGDVSAVNHGANPSTSIAARQQEIVADLRLAGPSVARAAYATLLQRDDLDLDRLVQPSAATRLAVADLLDEPPAEARGRSLTQIEALLQD